MTIKFHEEAIGIYAVKQNSKGNEAVKDNVATVGTITTALNSKTVTGVGTKFKYGATSGDGLGDLVVGGYIYNSDSSEIIGRVASITSNTVAVLEDNALVAVSAQEFATGLGPKNCMAVLNLNFIVNFESESYQYVGDELSREERTVIKDTLANFDFETFIPKMSTIASTNPTIDEVPYPHWFEACGLGVILSTDGSGTVEYTNSVASNARLTVEIRRTSQDDPTIQKTYVLADVWGSPDLDVTIATKGRFKWNMMGNFVDVYDKPRMDPDDLTFRSQKSHIAANLSRRTIRTAQLSLWTGLDNVDPPTFVDQSKTVCFDKLSAPNFSGFNYNRYLMSCEEDWSKGAVPTDISLNILEDKDEALYNPYDHVEGYHSLWLAFSPDTGLHEAVTIFFEKMQLTGIPPSKIAQYAAQDLKFRNIGTVSITFSAAELGQTGNPTSLKPKWGVGSANPDEAGLATLLSSMTDITASSDNGRSGSFTLTTTTGEYGWVAITAAAYGSGLHFYDGVGYGGWSGAGLAGNNTGDSPDPTLSITTILFNDVTWVFFRQDYVNACPAPGTTYTIS